MRLSLALATLVLAGCAATPTRFEVAGQAHDLHWLQPAQPASTLVVLAPGFARRCSHLNGLSLALRDAGLAVMCIDAPMAGGNPALADALGGWLAAGLPAPPWGPPPPRVLVAGHSAGAAFAARLGAQLQALAPQRLAGALLLDPVPGTSFAADVQVLAQAQVPLQALVAAPHACNAGGRAVALLPPAAIVQAGPGSTHVDAEGDDSDALARAACGTPDPAQVRALRDAAVRWVRGLA